MAQSPLLKRLRARAKEVSSRAFDELLADDARSEVLNAALRRVQQGRRTLDETGSRVLGTLGLANQEDLERVKKRIGRLRKRLRRIVDELEHEADES